MTCVVHGLAPALQVHLGVVFRHLARFEGYTVEVFTIVCKLAHLVYRTVQYRQAYTDIPEAPYELRCQ